MRLAVYTDYVYRRDRGVIYAERAFALFLAALAPQVEHLRLIGRLAPEGGNERYALPPTIELAPVPHYSSLANPASAVRSLTRSIGHMRAAVDDVDVVWVLGPYPHAIALTLVSLARRRKVVLGVRQNWPAYVRMRRPGRRWMHVAADVLEWTWRALARRLPVVVVGGEMATKYAHAPALLELVVSLVPASAVRLVPAPRDYGSQLRVLSVGRLEEEKNPLLLADVLALLREDDSRWRLVICGEGDLEPALRARLRDLGVLEEAEFAGYVAMGEQLFDLYRSCHALLHVSWTEGFPQVLIEAFATALPVVATDVGGVRHGVRDAALLIGPGDAEAAADALRRVVQDASLRARLSTAGLELARELTLERQTARLVRFLAQAAAGRAGAGGNLQAAWRSAERESKRRD